MEFTHKCSNRFCGKRFKGDIRHRWANCPHCDSLGDSVFTPHQRLNMQYRGSKRSAEVAVVFRNLDPKTKDETPYLYPGRNDVTHIPGFPMTERVELDSLAKLDAHYRETGKMNDKAHYDNPDVAIDTDDGSSDPDADLILGPESDFGVGMPE